MGAVTPPFLGSMSLVDRVCDPSGKVPLTRAPKYYDSAIDADLSPVPAVARRIEDAAMHGANSALASGSGEDDYQKSVRWHPPPHFVLEELGQLKRQ